MPGPSFLTALLECDSMLTGVRALCLQPQIAAYCSRECQTKHWKASHKKLCRATHPFGAAAR